MIYLNIGSGQRPFRFPFHNTDIQEKWKQFTLDAGCLWLPVEAVQATREPIYDIVVLHHVLEHFGCGEADGLIDLTHRILKPGGSLLVFVPDFRALAQGWLMHRIDTQIFMTNTYGAYMGDEADRHKWGYDTQSLTKYLAKWKWAELKLFNWREIEGSDIAKDWWILGMEAVK